MCWNAAAVEKSTGIELMLHVWRTSGLSKYNQWLVFAQDGKWAAEKVIQIPGKKVEGWALSTMPGLFMYRVIILEHVS